MINSNSITTTSCCTSTNHMYYYSTTPIHHKFKALSLSASSSNPQLCFLGLKWKHKNIESLKPRGRKFQFSWIIKSVLNNRTSSSISDSGASGHDRILLERLFTQTQKLEQQIGRDPHAPQVVELGANFGMQVSDIQAALLALKKKENDLQDAERRVLLEFNRKNRAVKNLQKREKELVAARVKQEKLEEELIQARVELGFQAAEIGELKIRLKGRDQEIADAQSALLDKEKEIEKMNDDFVKKMEEAEKAELELSSKARLLDETNKIVEMQEVELQQLRRAIHGKEKELESSRSTNKLEADKLKVSEGKLEKQTMDWLLVQQELKKLLHETSRHVEETSESMEEFGKVKKLLSDVRSELVLSQKVLVSTKQKVDGQEQILEKQLTELEELRGSITSYMVSLRDAQLELQSEKHKLRVAEAQKEELGRDLSMEKELVSELQKELEKERLSLEQAIQKLSSLKEEIDNKSTKFDETQILLQAKESELVEARLEIQRLKSEQDSFQLILEEKNMELSNANKMLEEVNQEIAELKRNLSNKEEELTQASSLLKEKDENVQTMKHQLNDAKLKCSDAERVVEQIVDLTREAVLSFNNDGFYAFIPHDQTIDESQLPVLVNGADSIKWRGKQLEAELELTRESLRAKEMEVLAMERAITIKDEELKSVLGELDTKEKEITQLKGEIHDKDDLKQLYSLAQERIGEKSIGDLAIEKLSLEAAQLEVEAATSALQNITQLSRELIYKTGFSLEADSNIILCENNVYGSKVNGILNCNDYPGEVKSEVTRLLSLTEQLVRDAGISGDTIH